MKPELFDSIQKIHQKLAKLSNISIEDLLIIKDIIKVEDIKAGEFFLRPGDSSQKVAIIIKGLSKTFYIMEDGKEYISHFGHEGSFIGVYTDMLKKIKSTGYVQALEDCRLVVMDYQEFLSVTKNSLAWAHNLRLLTEDRYIYRSDKDRNVTLKTAKERYEYFIKIHPELENRIPQNQIALYLNINPATLSRLKNGSGKYKGNSKSGLKKIT